MNEKQGENLVRAGLIGSEAEREEEMENGKGEWRVVRRRRHMGGW